MGPVPAHARARTCTRTPRLPHGAAGETPPIMGPRFMLMRWTDVPASPARACGPAPLYLLSLERQPFSTIGRPGCFRGLTLPALSLGKAFSRPFVVHTLGHTCLQTRVNAQLWGAHPLYGPAVACWLLSGSGGAPGSPGVDSRIVSK